MTTKHYYHYTSVAGGLGIISSRSVWLTDYRYLNDRRELRQGMESLLSKIPESHRSAFNRAIRWHDMRNHHCVFSLSSSPKILSQWRAYASDGTGFALGLNIQFLEYAGLSLVECRYEDHDKYGWELLDKHSRFIASVHSASKQHVGENDLMGWVSDQRSNFYSLIEDLIALKNPAFSEEKEMRAVWSKQSGELKMRTARDLIIPYVEAKIWPDDEETSAMAVVLPEVWLGPKCNDLNRWSLHAMNLGMCMIQRHDCGYV